MTISFESMQELCKAVRPPSSLVFTVLGSISKRRLASERSCAATTSIKSLGINRKIVLIPSPATSVSACTFQG